MHTQRREGDWRAKRVCTATDFKKGGKIVSEPTIVSEINPKKKSGFRLPDAQVLMVIIILIAVALSWILPAGEYDRQEDPNTGNVMVVPGSYHYVEKNPVGPVEFLTSIPAALQDVAGIFIFVILIGGAMGVVNATGAINAMIALILKKWGTKGRTIIWVLTIFFGFCASSFGLCSEGLVFIPILISLFKALGYDAVVAVGLVMGASATGYGVAPINPFNVGVAQGIAGLPLFSGMEFRWVLWVISFAILAWYISRYAEKVRRNPTQSLVYGVDYSDSALSEKALDEMKMTSAHVRVLVIFFGAIAFLIFASIKNMLPTWAAYSAVFLTMGILAGLASGMNGDKLVEEYTKGCNYLLYAALTLGTARAIGLVLESGRIIDTIVYWLVKPLEILGAGSSYVGGIIMVWIQFALNLIMPSNSGQAMATMPIMLPMGDLIGLNKQITVLAFQMGDGLTMMLFPTFGIIMAALALAKVPFDKWLRFALPLAGIQMVVAMIAIVVAIMIDLGPF